MEKFFNCEEQKQKIEYLAEFADNLDYYIPRLMVCNKNCAYALANLTKKKLAKEILLSNIERYEELVQSFIFSQDAKIRKYGYVISGNCPTKKLQNLLVNQIEQEQTYFVLPSLMLSLVGNNCKLLLARVEREKELIAPKIYREILQNYNLKNPADFDKCTDFIFNKHPALLRTQKCYEDVLLPSLKQYKKQKSKLGIKLEITPQDYQILAKKRDIYSLSLILCEDNDLNTCVINGLKTLATVIPKGNFSYRISCEEKDKNALCLSVAKSLTIPNLTNSASNYSVSVELLVSDGFMLVASLEDCKQKFTYRTEFLPASINPVTANIIANVCQKFNPDAKVVADVFCGTATMLIERYFVKNDIKLIGSDISKIALDKAQTNLNNANIKAKLCKLDVANFKIGGLDEILSNLPYGLRVGSHEDNEIIYKNLIKICQNCLKVGGFAFLYTADKKLLKNLIKKSSLTLVEEMPFISGGLYCSLFIVKKAN